jgi:hypothetical protein
MRVRLNVRMNEFEAFFGGSIYGTLNKIKVKIHEIVMLIFHY